MSEHLNFEEKDYGFKICVKGSHRTVGKLVKEVDGDYYFEPNSGGGLLPRWALKEVSKKMKKLNKDTCIELADIDLQLPDPRELNEIGDAYCEFESKTNL